LIGKIYKYNRVAIKRLLATKKMNLTCPQCNQQLPDVEELRYRFCPHCGAAIVAEPRPLDEAFLTIPPQSPPPPVDAEPLDADPVPEKTSLVADQFEDQTLAPQPKAPQKRPQIIPPTEPPPPTFFRTPPSAPDPPPALAKKRQTDKMQAPPPKSPQKTAAKKHQKVIMAVLIILALVILILGGLFTF
jgi:DNA-directed RNA polymerase subunit RPC12/RpoP